MLNKFSTSERLYLLIFITATSLIGLGLYGIGDLKKMDENTRPLFEDRVVCIQQLATIRFQYLTQILPIAQSVKNQELTFKEAKKRIVKAEEIINTNWHDYKRTYLTTEEALLARQTDVVKKQADGDYENLESILSKQDTQALNKLAQNQNFAPSGTFIAKISQLMDLQVRVSKEIFHNNRKIYFISSSNFLLLVFLSLVVALSLSCCIIKNIRDLIKDILNSNSEIRESEQKYRSLLEHASDAIYTLDFKGNFTDVNESMCKTTGYTRDELLHMNIAELADPEQLKTDLITHGCVEPGTSVIRERRLVNKNRSIFEAEVNVKRFADDQTLVIARDITERKRMEANVRDAELKFRTLAEKSMVGVYIIQRGRYIYVNPRFAGVFGYEPEELINSTDITRVIHEDYRHLTDEYIRHRLTGEVQSVHYEAMGKKKDGTTNWVEFYGSAAIIDNEPTIIGTMIDITDRKIAEELILKEKALSETIINSLPGVFYLRDKHGKGLRWNKNLETVTGYTPQEIEGTILREFIAEKDRAIVSSAIEKVFKDGYATAEVEVVSKDGTTTPFLLTGKPINYENQPCLLGIGIDISSRIEAEESLKKSEANLKTIMDTTDTAYALLDTELNVMASNQMMIEFVKSQYHHKPVKGEHLADYVPKERLRQFMGHANKVLKGESISYEVSYRQADGSALWYDVRLYPITNDRNEVFGLMLALSNVTGHKMAEIHLGELNENLQKHAKELAISNAELEQFAYVASHDLQEPLRMVSSFMTQLEKKYGDVVDEKGRQYIYFAVDGAKRMRRIISDLLDFSRVGRTEDDLEQVDFNKLTNEVLALFRRKIEDVNARISVENLPVIQTYKTPFRQVFQNLIDNSLKYHAGGAPSMIKISCKETKTHFQFAIKDNGIGIDPAYFDKIFIIFQRLHNRDEYSGTGMGLALTKKIIENIGGKIWVDSEEGKGSTFYFTLLKKQSA